MSLLPGYETTIITRQDLSDDGLKALVEKLTTAIGPFEGKVVYSEDWGKKKLAFAIQKENRGHYTYLVYTGKGDVVHEVERNLRIHDHVLRYLTVNLGAEFNAETFQADRVKATANAKKREEEREARREERNAERARRTEHSYDDRDYGAPSSSGSSGPTPNPTAGSDSEA